jgi:hypothetical protein
LAKLKDAQRLAARNSAIKPVKPPADAGDDDKKVSQTTYAQVIAFMRSALSRAKRFHAALGAQSRHVPVELYAYGGNCAQTLDAAVLIRDPKNDQWTTLLQPRDIRTSGGRELRRDELRNVMFSLGDGRVTTRSLMGETEMAGAVKTLFPLKGSFFSCGSHTKLFLEKQIQDSFLSALVVEKTNQP